MTLTSMPAPVPTGTGSADRVSLDDHVAAWALSHPDDVAFTFVDYAASDRGAASSLTWSAIDRRVAGIGARIRGSVRPGDRVAVLAPQGLDYIAAFLAAQRVGAIAVPLFPPDLPGHADRLTAVLADCVPAVVLTTSASAHAVHEFLAVTGPRPAPEVVDVTGLPARPVTPVRRSATDVAYLQYTSGSTRTPAGVVLSHRNVVANAWQSLAGYDAALGDDTTTVSWLPLFHDMGLVLAVAAPVVGRLRTVLMDPVAFLQRPGRWLKLLSASDSAVSAAPNFAYGYAAARVTEQERAWLQLDHVKALINGAEPIQPATIRRFHDAFAECGLRPEAHRPSYGLAEATVFVSVSPAGRAPRVTEFDRAALQLGLARSARSSDGESTTLVSCGLPVAQQVRIVDPDTRRPRPDGEVGEIWVSGPNIGAGYWHNEPASRRTFGAVLTSTGQAPVGGWLRTGDLGVVHGGELYVTGRIKDLIVIDGRNHYPQDIETTVEQAHEAIRAHHVAACPVPSPAGERLVVLAERPRRLDPADLDEAAVDQAVRSAVAGRHAVSVHDFVLLEPGQVPRTSSGKVARAAAREAYLAGRYRRAEAR